MLIEEAINLTVKEYGYGIFETQRRFEAIIKDYNPYISQSRKLDFEACCNNGILTFMRELCSLTDITEIEILSKKIKHYLIAEKRLSSETAVSGINLFLTAFNKNYILDDDKIPETPIGIDIQELRSDLCGVPINQHEFLTLFNEIDSGNVDAMIRLGDCYCKGIIVQKDLHFATCYYKMAIKNGSLEAKQKYLDMLNEEREENFR